MNKQATKPKARDQDKPGRKPAKTAKKQARQSGRAARRQAKFASRVARRPALARKAKTRAAASAASSADPVLPVPSEPEVELPARVAARSAARASARSAAKASARSAAKRSKAAAKRPSKLVPRVASTRATAPFETAEAAAPVWSRRSVVPGADEADSLEVAERQLTMLVRTSALLGQEHSSALPLDRSSYLLLYTLEKHGPCTISTLAAEVCLAASTVTRQVAAMCSAGLVASEPAAEDRRARVVTMQAHGRELFTAERGRRRRLLRAITGSWSEDEWQEFAELLARLNASLGELFDGAPLAYQR